MAYRPTAIRNRWRSHDSKAAWAPAAYTDQPEISATGRGFCGVDALEIWNVSLVLSLLGFAFAATRRCSSYMYEDE